MYNASCTWTTLAECWILEHPPFWRSVLAAVEPMWTGMSVGAITMERLPASIKFRWLLAATASKNCVIGKKKEIAVLVRYVGEYKRNQNTCNK